MRYLRQSLAYFGLMLMFYSCCHEDTSYNAIVMGADLRLCACCGGLLIKTNDGKTYQAYKYPDALDPIAKNDFPYQVSIDYQLQDNTCFASDGIIEISKVEF
ncbi:MAG: hypothetical protein IPN29_05220 [Saprospiraceae bacterium]|nr:hypothetical protein [Saprospiraceae bacterium]